jgi:hypothetical protein
VSIFKYVDPDDGLAYEMTYVVTQSPDEGPEYVEWRLDPSQAGSLEMDTSWHRLPPWAMPPEEAIEFWHGTVSKVDAKTNNDLNDLAGALYRLTVDLKRLGVIPKEFHFSS